MKTKETKLAEKTLMDELREIRDKINFEIKDLTFDQLKKYWKNQPTLHQTRIWQNG